ncbi:MAG TPA: alpha/beta fold hydrolase [Ktedonobacterales bacterium]|nr:alpha/beta fold hydrolase [Ktedonobacterales bacterium]
MRAYTERIVFTPSADQRAQAGVLMRPTEGSARPTGIVCIHGSPGFFYFPMYVSLGRALAERGIRFVSGNTRGHDAAALDFPWPYSFRPEDRAKWRVGGSSFVRWDEEPHDVAGWINFLVAQGAEQIVLFGHSAGAIRVLYYQAERQDPRVVGLILASGSDRVPAIDPARLELAQRLVAEGQEDALLPVPEGGPLVAGMESAANVVHLDRIVGRFAAEGHAPWIASIRVPVLATHGTVDWNTDLPARLEAMRGRAVRAPRFDIQVIEGADHCYTGHDQEFAEVVARWLEALPVAKGTAKRRWWGGRQRSR